jgi:hypothetical protein
VARQNVKNAAAFHSFRSFAASAAFEEIGVTNNSARTPRSFVSDLRERIQQQRDGDISYHWVKSRVGSEHQL